LTLVKINVIIFEDQKILEEMSVPKTNESGCPFRSAGLMNVSTANKERTPRVPYDEVRSLLGADRVFGPEFCPKKLLPKLGRPPFDEDIAIPLQAQCLEKLKKGNTHEHVKLFCVPFFLPVPEIADSYPRIFGDMQGLPVPKNGLLRPHGVPDWVWFAIPKASPLNYQVGTLDVQKAVYANIVSMRTTGTHLFSEEVACSDGNRIPRPVTVVFGRDGIISFPAGKRIGERFHAYGVELKW
jgi:hypothetical protein